MTSRTLAQPGDVHDAGGSGSCRTGANRGSVFRFGDDGKVIEIWNHRDDLGLMEQLGAPIFAGAPADKS